MTTIKVINTETEISNPEITAMLMAFYSRSSEPIENRLHSLGENEQQIKESLKKYYLGYGHSSIGDCGDASIFIEGLSILAAKALENHPLFNGQETSTRYFDFSKQGYHDPLNKKEIIENWISFYLEILPQVKNELFILWSSQRPEHLKSENIFENALNAKTFDICRSLLPAAINTQMGIKMTFSSLLEHLHKLSLHPTEEVKELSSNILDQLMNQYSSTFKLLDDHKKIYMNSFVEKEFFLKDVPFNSTKRIYSPKINSSKFDGTGLFDSISNCFSLRPRNSYLPKYLSKFGNIEINYSLDYGSWRDLQRHRNTVTNLCTSLSNIADFNFKYFDILSDSLKQKIDNFIIDQYEQIFLLQYNNKDYLYELQYYYPLGNHVNAQLILTFPELLYILELRSSKSVHFTLRKLIHDIIRNLPYNVSSLLNSIKHYIDFSDDDFFLGRGNQTIFKNS